jgi:predicted transcriptional regulator
MLLQTFKNKYRPRIIKYLIKNRNKRVYVSEVAAMLKISKGSAFVNLSELEESGILSHRWETIKIKGKVRRGLAPIKLVKSYTLNPHFTNIVRNTIESLLKETKPLKRGAHSES